MVDPFTVGMATAAQASQMAQQLSMAGNVLWELGKAMTGSVKQSTQKLTSIATTSETELDRTELQDHQLEFTVETHYRVKGVLKHFNFEGPTATSVPIMITWNSGAADRNGYYHVTDLCILPGKGRADPAFYTKVTAEWQVYVGSDPTSGYYVLIALTWIEESPVGGYYNKTSYLYIYGNGDVYREGILEKFIPTNTVTQNPIRRPLPPVGTGSTGSSGRDENEYEYQDSDNIIVISNEQLAHDLGRLAEIFSKRSQTHRQITANKLAELFLTRYVEKYSHLLG